jgi:hypothetical protein
MPAMDHPGSTLTQDNAMPYRYREPRFDDFPRLTKQEHDELLWTDDAVRRGDLFRKAGWAKLTQQEKREFMRVRIRPMRQAEILLRMGIKAPVACRRRW